MRLPARCGVCRCFRAPERALTKERMRNNRKGREDRDAYNF
ncbi:hypothetical protein HMPREF9124_0526 [Oribacterium sp. oral taxon 108 str. F0425]|nr:hypothetical protein HMPREF9124_0526 [Oribacterium sp. oral taxon 108 str. F0425]